MKAKTPAIQYNPDGTRKPTGRGGWRPGSGRPRGENTISHLRRPDVRAGVPQLVVLTLADDVPTVRGAKGDKLLREAVGEGGSLDTFRVRHMSMVGHAIHLIVDADDGEAMAKGMQGLNVRIARNLNAVFERSGSLLAHRYAATELPTPKDVKAALKVMNIDPAAAKKK